MSNVNQCFVRDGSIVLVAPDGEYPIDLSRCDDPVKILAWVHHLADKLWVTPKLIKAFILLAADKNGIEITYDA